MSRTLVLTSTYPQYPGDPRGAFLRTHWEAQAEDAHHVTVLAPRTAWCRGDVGERCAVRRFSYAPTRWATLTGRHGILANVRERVGRALWIPALVWAASRALHRELDAGVQLVVGHMLLPFGVVVARACRRRDIAFDIYAHGTDVDVFLKLPGFIRRRLVRDLAHARRIHVPSRDKAERLRTVLPNMEFVVETMVHCVSAPPGSAAVRDVDVLFLGRLIAQKGVDTLLRALARVENPGRMVIAGDGPERPRLERLARELGLCVEFTGFVEAAKRDRLLASARLVAVPSRSWAGLSEGSPLVVVEALAAGAFVLGSDEGGIPDLLADAAAAGGAKVLPAGDVDAWARALARSSLAA